MYLLGRASSITLNYITYIVAVNIEEDWCG